MFDILNGVWERYEQLGKLLSDPIVIADRENYQKYAKEHSEKTPIVEKYLEWKSLRTRYLEAKEILSDSSADKDLTELARLDLEEAASAISEAEERLKVLLIAKDPYDDKNIYLEIRAGTGGDEASLFAADLYRMYTRYAELEGWKTELVGCNETGVGGYREAILLVKGNRAYSRLKYEAGGHRVQRIPETEASGRIHTSACTVAVMPEADEVDVHIEPKDIRVDVYRSGGAGGQHINTTDSAVRITHIPTNIVVTCQDERSQIKNKERAMKLLLAKILEDKIARQNSERADSRKLQVGSGDRSERIRTYNFPQNRLTDHRINLTVYNLDRVMEGELGEILSEIMAFDQAEKLKEAGLS
ncbi:MAG: peptide chain release factor 1 [Deferribacteraceae bacterium]|jgi:peptide chain release factor 1|nr:peptide chain release factor 1 [Deferribacteraceae bacterium]